MQKTLNAKELNDKVNKMNKTNKEGYFTQKHALYSPLSW